MVGVSSRLPLMNSITSCILFTPYTDRLLTTAASRAFCEGTINPSNPSSRALMAIGKAPLMGWIVPSRLNSPIIM